MDGSSETKNLVNIYQKIFNVASKRLRKQAKGKKPAKINVRACSGLSSLKRLLVEHPELKKMLESMWESGEMLAPLLKWKGNYSNLATAIKYFNVLVNVIYNP